MARGGVPFQYGRGKCIFCQRQPPDVPMSKEHLFGDWLRELFPRNDATTHMLGVLEWIGAPFRSKPTERIKPSAQGHSGSKKVRHVCKECNEGWLSEKVESAAKPILTSVLRGDVVEIDEDMQRIIATWAAKTVMVAEYVHPHKAVIPQGERTWLKENLSPPAGWTIWIGTYDGIFWRDLSVQQHAGTLTIPTVNNGDPSIHYLESTVIGMGRLMFFVASSSWPRLRQIIETVGSPRPPILVQIWPIVHSRILWPRTPSLTDSDANQMLGAYSNQILSHRT
jgi:hypothetical protein